MHFQPNTVIGKITYHPVSINFMQLATEIEDDQIKYTGQKPCYNHLKHKSNRPATKAPRIHSMSADITAEKIGKDPTLVEMQEIEKARKQSTAYCIYKPQLQAIIINFDRF